MSDIEAQQPLLGAGADCPDGVCAMPPRRPKPVITKVSAARDSGVAAPARRARGEHHLHGPDKQSLAASIATLLLTLPALVGSCCWPLLLAGFMGITATAGAKAFSHTFSLALTLAILTNLTQYSYWKSAYKVGGTLWSRQGPTILLAIATPLLLADLMRHCLQDADLWPPPSSSMYYDGCPYSVRGLSGLRCLTLVGWIFSIVCTYTGFILMMISIVWGANLSEKLRHAWSQIYLNQPEPEYVLCRGGDASLDVNSPPCHTIPMPSSLDDLYPPSDDGSGSTHVMLHMFQIRKRRPSETANPQTVSSNQKSRVRDARGRHRPSPEPDSSDGGGSSSAVKLKEGRPITRFNIQVTTK